MKKLTQWSLANIGLIAFILLLVSIVVGCTYKQMESESLASRSARYATERESLWQDLGGGLYRVPDGESGNTCYVYLPGDALACVGGEEKGTR